jgi:hypothetical protein
MGIIFGFGRGGAGGGGGQASAPKLPPPAAKNPPAVGPEPKEGERGGALIAWDPVNQKERWRMPGGGGIGGGTVTTSGNLVIQVIPDGRMVIYSADKGDKLYEVQTGLRGGMGPPITYQVDGKQYVSFMGGTGPVPRFNFGGGGGGGGNNAPAPAAGGNAAAPGIGGNATAGTAAPAPGTAGAAEQAPPPGFGGGTPVLPKLLTFVLDGKAPMPVPTPAPAPPATP